MQFADSNSSHFSPTFTHSGFEETNDYESVDDATSAKSFKSVIKPPSQTKPEIEEQSKQQLIQLPQSSQNDQLEPNNPENSNQPRSLPSTTHRHDVYRLLNSAQNSKEACSPISSELSPDLDEISFSTPMESRTNRDKGTLESIEVSSPGAGENIREITPSTEPQPASTPDGYICFNTAHEVVSQVDSNLTTPERHRHSKTDTMAMPLAQESSQVLSGIGHKTAHFDLKTEPVPVEEVQKIHSTPATDTSSLSETKVTSSNSVFQLPSVGENAEVAPLDLLVESSSDVEKRVIKSALVSELSPIAECKFDGYGHSQESIPATKNQVSSIGVTKSSFATDNWVDQYLNTKESTLEKDPIDGSDQISIQKLGKPAPNTSVISSMSEGEQTQKGIDELAISSNPTSIGCCPRNRASDVQSVITTEEDFLTTAASNSPASRDAQAFISPIPSPERPKTPSAWPKKNQKELHTHPESKSEGTDVGNAAILPVLQTGEDQRSLPKSDDVITEGRFILLPSPMYMQTSYTFPAFSEFAEQPVELQLRAPAVYTEADVQTEPVQAGRSPLLIKPSTEEIIMESSAIQMNNGSTMRSTVSKTASTESRMLAEKSVRTENDSEECTDSKRFSFFSEVSRSYNEAKEELNAEREKLRLKHEFRRKRIAAVEQRMVEARDVYLTACKRYEEKRLVVGRILRGLRDGTVDTSDNRYFRLFEKNETDESLNGPSRKFLVDDDGNICVLRQMVAKLDMENIKLQAEVDRQKEILQTMRKSLGVERTIKTDTATRLVTPPDRARQESKQHAQSADRASSHPTFVECLENADIMQIPTRRRTGKSSQSGSLHALHHEAQSLVQMTLSQGGDKFKQSTRENEEDHSDTGTRKVQKMNPRLRVNTLSGNPWAALKRRSIERRLIGSTERRVNSRTSGCGSENVRQSESPSSHRFVNRTPPKNSTQALNNKLTPASGSTRKQN